MSENQKIKKLIKRTFMHLCEKKMENKVLWAYLTKQ